jgi:hypothetical protein
MAGLDDLFAQIPTREIATRIGADEADVKSAIQALVPVLVGGLHENAQNPEQASEIESAVSKHAARGLLDTGVSLDQVDESDGQKAIAKIFGGNDTSQVAAALSGSGNHELVQSSCRSWRRSCWPISASNWASRRRQHRARPRADS